MLYNLTHALEVNVDRVNTNGSFKVKLDVDILNVVKNDLTDVRVNVYTPPTWRITHAARFPTNTRQSSDWWSKGAGLHRYTETWG